jgi:hypothetical protein
MTTPPKQTGYSSQNNQNKRITTANDVWNRLPWISANLPLQNEDNINQCVESSLSEAPIPLPPLPSSPLPS